MNEYESKITHYIAINHIDAEHLVYPTSCHSVEEAAASAKAKVDEFVKNVCLISDDKELIVAIIPGERKLDLMKTAAILSTKNLRLAKRDEVLQRTGYPAGGTPSFGYPAKFLIDRSVMTKSIIYSGGGSQNSLIRISPSEILRANNAAIADLIK